VIRLPISSAGRGSGSGGMCGSERCARTNIGS
jgi:hypothetical protein